MRLDKNKNSNLTGVRKTFGTCTMNLDKSQMIVTSDMVAKKATTYVDYFDEIVDLVNEQDEELQNLKNQIKIYELFLDQNDLNIEWDLFCTLNHCVNEEDTGCQTCKYMGLVDGDFE